MELALHSETSEYFYQSAWRGVPIDSIHGRNISAVIMHTFRACSVIGHDEECYRGCSVYGLISTTNKSPLRRDGEGEVGFAVLASLPKPVPRRALLAIRNAYWTGPEGLSVCLSTLQWSKFC